MFATWSPHARYRLYTSAASYVPQLAKTNAIERFESEICRRFNVAAAVCVPMARTGLYLALLETIRPGQKVILSPLTIVDVVNAVILAGGVPVFADIVRNSCSIDPDEAESLVDRQTAAILITHLHGQTAGAHVFREICTRRGIRLIEDAAQAFGAIESKRRLGTIGDAGIYSFGFFKNLSTWRGGMVVSNDRQLIERIRSRILKFRKAPRAALLKTCMRGLMVDAGTWPPIFSQITHTIVRSNFPIMNSYLDPEFRASRLDNFPQRYLMRMREWQALIGIRHLDRIDDDTRARMVHAHSYGAGLRALPELIKPEVVDDFSNIYSYFPVQVPDREKLLRYALSNRHRDFAAQHLRNCAQLSEFREFHRPCPRAQAAASELILLPTYPRYPAREVQLNIEVIRDFLVKKTRRL